MEQKSKKSSSMKFLQRLMFIKPHSKFYRVKNLHNTPWKDIRDKSSLYYSVVLCLPKSTTFSRDHIFAISQGWIFDSNLDYAILLNETNLSWCAGHGKDDIRFSGFHEIYQISYNKPPHKKGKK